MKRPLLFLWVFLLPSLAFCQGAGAWWQIYQDPELNALVEQAFAQNGLVEAGQARVNAALQTAQASRGYYLPNVSVDPLLQQQNLAPNRPLPINANGTRFSLNTINLPLNASYDLNFWLKKNQVKQGQNGAEQQSAILDQTKLSLAAQVVQAVVAIRTADWTLAVLDRNASLLDSIQQLLDARYAAGLTNELAPSLNRTQRETLEIDRANATRARKVGLAQLAGLLGKPTDLAPKAAPASTLPVDTVGAQASLSARPDVRLSRQQMEAGKLSLQLLDYSRKPRPFVSASSGYTSKQVENLVSTNSLTYTIAGGISIPLWDWRNNRYHAQAALQELKARQALLHQQLATAQGGLQVADANLTETRTQIAAVNKALRNAQYTIRLSTELFTRGLTSFIDVLTAQQNLISLQTRLATLQGQYYLCIADYYVARGGR